MQTPTILKKRPTVAAAGGQHGAEGQRVSLELVTPSWEIRTDDLMQVLSDNRDFLVVGVLGTQGSGKSTLVNHLCDLCPCTSHWIGGRPVHDHRLPPLATHQSWAELSHVTKGIEVRVNAIDGVIALDSPPLLSPSLLADLAVGVHKVPSILPVLFNRPQDAQVRDSRAVSAEAAQLVMALQSIIFFLCTCHVVSAEAAQLVIALQYIISFLCACRLVVVMVDTLDQPDLIQLLLLAEMIASTLPDVSVAGMPSGAAGQVKVPLGRIADCALVLSTSRPHTLQPHVMNPHLEMWSTLLADSAFCRSVHLKHPYPRPIPLHQPRAAQPLPSLSAANTQQSTPIPSAADSSLAADAHADTTPLKVQAPGPPSADLPSANDGWHETVVPPASQKIGLPTPGVQSIKSSSTGANRGSTTWQINFHMLARDFSKDSFIVADAAGGRDGNDNESREAAGAGQVRADELAGSRSRSGEPAAKGGSRDHNQAGKQGAGGRAFHAEHAPTTGSRGTSDSLTQYKAAVGVTNDTASSEQQDGTCRVRGCHVGVQGHVIDQLKNALLRFPRRPFSRAGISEREWLKGCEAVWQRLQTSQDVADVCARVCQTWYSGAGGLGWAGR